MSRFRGLLSVSLSLSLLENQLSAVISLIKYTVKQVLSRSEVRVLFTAAEKAHASLFFALSRTPSPIAPRLGI